MPTVLRVGRFRFFFFSNEGSEPPHVHIESDDQYAKIWLDPLRLAASRGYNARELSEILRLATQHQQVFLEKWHEYFRNS